MRLDLPAWGCYDSRVVMPKKKIKRRAVPIRRKTPSGERRPAELARTLMRHIVAQDWIAPGQRIGVAVSGGADSVALLRLFLELRKELGVVLSVVHFNHQLRGAASDRDEKFVTKLAFDYGLPFFVMREDVGTKAEQERANVEDTARRSRYAFFERLAAECKLDRVSVAHTAEDQAETVLWHLLRGTGVAGLGGIHPESGVVFRPLLTTRRAALRAYLRGLRQKWQEDASNRDLQRTRARIRQKLLPLLEKEFQPAVVEHLCQLANLAREDDAWLDSSAELRVFLNAKETADGWRLSIWDLIEAPAQRSAGQAADPLWSRRAVEAMSKRMVRVLVKKVKPRAGQLSLVHVDAVLRLAQQPDSGKCLHLPGGVQVRRERDSLCFRPLEPRVDAPAKAFAYTLDLSAGHTELRGLEHLLALRFQVIDWPRQGRETKGTGAVLDRDKLRSPLVLRNWRPGDSVQPVGHLGHHKLSRLLNEVGVSRWDKGSWPVLTTGGKIAWCRGLPVAAEFAVGGSTRAGVVITEVPLA
jgi:tRNA(Ile)-lysidine synthase